MIDHRSPVGPAGPALLQHLRRLSEAPVRTFYNETTQNSLIMTKLLQGSTRRHIFLAYKVRDATKESPFPKMMTPRFARVVSRLPKNNVRNMAYGPHPYADLEGKVIVVGGAGNPPEERERASCIHS